MTLNKTKKSILSQIPEVEEKSPGGITMETKEAQVSNIGGKGKYSREIDCKQIKPQPSGCS